MSKNVVLDAINEHDVKFIDLRFTDIRGKEQHYTIPAAAVDDEFIENGRTIDGSSFKGWQKIHQSDLALIPDLDSVQLDPFFQDNTLFIRCNVVDPQTMIGYDPPV
jgi:glutamine synthetase